MTVGQCHGSRSRVSVDWSAVRSTSAVSGGR